jgi:hypothetical protein
MFSNVGMNPYGPGGGIVTQQPQTATLPQSDARSAVRGESGAAAARAETAERVDPARQAVPAAPLPDRPPSLRSPEFGTRFVPMVTPQQAGRPEDRGAQAPDDGAPAGPPPAFRRTPLEARQAETSAPDPAPATISAPAPPETATTTATDPVAVPEPDIVAEETAGPATSAEKGPESAASDTEDDRLRAAIRRLLADGDPAPGPPSAEKRAEEGIAGLRRMDVPYDTATVDLSR